MPLELSTTDPAFEAAFARFLATKREVSEDVDQAARAIIAQVRRDGDAALIEQKYRVLMCISAFHQKNEVKTEEPLETRASPFQFDFFRPLVV